MDDLRGEFTHAADIKTRALPTRSLCGIRVRHKTYKPGELAALKTPPAPKCPRCLALDAGLAPTLVAAVELAAIPGRMRAAADALGRDGGGYRGSALLSDPSDLLRGWADDLDAVGALR